MKNFYVIVLGPFFILQTNVYYQKIIHCISKIASHRLPTISLIVEEEVPWWSQYYVANISILIMAIAPSHEIVYYHNFLKMLRATVSIQTSSFDVETMFIRGNQPKVCKRRPFSTPRLASGSYFPSGFSSYSGKVLQLWSIIFKVRPGAEHKDPMMDFAAHTMFLQSIHRHVVSI